MADINTRCLIDKARFKIYRNHYYYGHYHVRYCNTSDGASSVSINLAAGSRAFRVLVKAGNLKILILVIIVVAFHFLQLLVIGEFSLHIK